MKSLLFLFISLTSCLTVFAQDEKAIVGKWKIFKAKIDGMVFDAENPEKTRAEIARHMQNESGEKPDSMALEATLDELTNGLATMIFEFTEDRKSILYTVDEDGKPEQKISTFTLDLAKGIMIVESKRNGVLKKRTVKIKLVDGVMTMIALPEDIEGSEMEFELKRIN